MELNCSVELIHLSQHCNFKQRVFMIGYSTWHVVK